MTVLLTGSLGGLGYLLALLISLWTASWRIAFLALGAEALLTGLILLHGEGFGNWATRVQVLDLLIVRALLVPFFFMRVLASRKPNAVFDPVRTSSLTWICAAVLLLGSYGLGNALFPADPQNAILLGAAASGVLLGLLILSFQSQILGQIIGLLTLESAIGLLEVTAPSSVHWEIQLGLTLAFLWSITILSRFLKEFIQMESDSSPAFEEREVL